MTITSVFWLAYYPVWSLAFAAMEIMVIYGIAMYGGKTAEA